MIRFSKIRSNHWQKIRGMVLWVGVIFCLVTLWRMHDRLAPELKRIYPSFFLGCMSLAILAWLFAVLGWRVLIAAFFKRWLSWSDAFHQSGLLLVGKYVPGGVAGLFARAACEEEGESRSEHLLVGLYEQVSSVWAMIGLGVLLVSAVDHGLLVLLVAPLMVVFALLFTRFAIFIVRHQPLPSLRKLTAIFHSLGLRHLAAAHIALQLSAVCWMVLVAWLAQEIYDQNIYAAFGLAGAYALSVAAGILAIFVPSGIIIRESSFIFLSSNWLNSSDALALAAFLRMITTLLDGVAGAVAFIFPLSRRIWRSRKL